MRAAERLKTCEVCGGEWRPSKPGCRTCNPKCRAILRERETPSQGHPREYPQDIVDLVVNLYMSGKTVREVQDEIPRGFKAQNIIERFIPSRRIAGKRNQSGESNHMWRGDEAGNTAVHLRLRSTRGPAGQYSCVDCHGPAREWSYEGGAPDEQPSARGPYTSDLTYYAPRCISCHRTYDNKLRRGSNVEAR